MQLDLQKLLLRWGIQGPTHAQVQQSARIFGRNVIFAWKALVFSKIPETGFPEVAFIGRSNTGKSTCINFLTNKRLAKTSTKPGRTRTMNGFIVSGKIGLVDLPGYGMGSREAWGIEIMKYLKERRQLRRVFVLIGSDCGFKETDRMILNSLNDWGVSYQILITKIDKLKKQSETLSTLFFEAKNIIDTYGGSGFPEVLGIKCIHPTIGINDLRWAIIRACGL
ncbi:hypothetical protein PORY_001640 [Pneumocystis oryctolagi]|uniref:Uncharacterized protein n=1 Tax=Pneumocystis oryctolagi TaxID=42067 RepID=A0ACB7CC43_9ASCO|nr:hypothetical protein PORY_001640 [Pneumocystis oryctolagi]